MNAARRSTSATSLAFQASSFSTSVAGATSLGPRRVASSSAPLTTTLHAHRRSFSQDVKPRRATPSFFIRKQHTEGSTAAPSSAASTKPEANGNGMSVSSPNSSAPSSASSSASPPSSPSSSSKKSSTSSQVQEHEQDGTSQAAPRRSMLYVPGSSEKMIKKSQQSDADCIIFDLEDSVAAHRKGAAREAVLHGLNAAPRPGPELAVRINPPSGDQSIASDDLDIILPSRQLQAIVLPKVESADDVKMVIEKAEHLRTDINSPISLILSIESANSLLCMPSIIDEVRSWGKDDVAYVSALLFASEDYCASTSIIRTKSRRELLFPRAQMATVARAYNLAAIDMVCVDYKDEAYLLEECQDGRELGYDGKQAIHPAQVKSIQASFSPSEADVLRAARMKHAYEKSVAEHKGAVGMKEGDSMVMIDAPMLKQAETTLAKARAGNMKIPEIKDE